MQELVSTIDFRYITDEITPEEAIELLKSKETNRSERQVLLESKGYPAYTTQIGICLLCLFQFILITNNNDFMCKDGSVIRMTQFVCCARNTWPKDSPLSN